MKKMAALMAGFLILGMTFAVAQERTQSQAQEKAQVQTEIKAQTKAQAKLQAKSEFRQRNRVVFVDENGDGINDLARDADGDGIPNCQDPDWTRPLDGSGYQARHKMGPSDGTGKGQAQKPGFVKGAFRSGATAAARMSGSGVCDGTGPKGSVQRKGRR